MGSNALQLYGYCIGF